MSESNNKYQFAFTHVQRAVTLLSLLMLCACVSKPVLLDDNLSKFQNGSKKETIIEKVVAQTDGPDIVENQKISTPIDSNRKWWLTLNDECLNQLIDELIAKNYSLKAATLRLAAETGASSATLLQVLPKGTVGATSTLSKNTGTSQSIYSKEPSAFDYRQNTHNKALNMSWDLPLFGQISALKYQSQAELDYAYWTMRSVELNITQEFAHSYYEYGFTSKQIQVLEQEIKEVQHQLQNEKILKNRGFSTNLEVQKIEIVLSDLSSQLSSLNTTKLQARQKIASILGLVDDLETQRVLSLIEKSSVFSNNQALFDVPNSIDANSIRSQPNVALAESKVLAATASKGLARAALYPQFTLQGSMSAVNGDLDSQGFNKGSARSKVASIGFHIPLLDWFYLKAQADKKLIEEEASINDYRQSVVDTWNEAQAIYEETLVRKNIALEKEIKVNILKSQLNSLGISFSKGLISKNELSQANRAFLQAKQEYISFVKNFMQIKLRLVKD